MQHRISSGFCDSRWRCQPSPLNDVLIISSGNKWSSQPLRLWPASFKQRKLGRQCPRPTSHRWGVQVGWRQWLWLATAGQRGLDRRGWQEVLSSVDTSELICRSISTSSSVVAAPPSRQTLACQVMEITCEYRRHRFSPAKSVSRGPLGQHGAAARVPKPLPKGFFF